MRQSAETHTRGRAREKVGELWIEEAYTLAEHVLLDSVSV